MLLYSADETVKKYKLVNNFFCFRMEGKWWKINSNLPGTSTGRWGARHRERQEIHQPIPQSCWCKMSSPWFSRGGCWQSRWDLFALDDECENDGGCFYQFQSHHHLVTLTLRMGEAVLMKGEEKEVLLNFVENRGVGKTNKWRERMERWRSPKFYYLQVPRCSLRRNRCLMRIATLDRCLWRMKDHFGGSFLGGFGELGRIPGSSVVGAGNRDR